MFDFILGMSNIRMLVKYCQFPAIFIYLLPKLFPEVTHQNYYLKCQAIVKK